MDEKKLIDKIKKYKKASQDAFFMSKLIMTCIIFYLIHYVSLALIYSNLQVLYKTAK